ncbi:uncharacterized protein LOC143034393 [Oratosquilla oratoria]|uniref:uncharacterized protein LOC143034393 n=1 Tax=Oratosquilla oratoria TaxID=337810 RepID=UPI003F775120
MEDDSEELREIVNSELSKLGIEDEVTKRSGKRLGLGLSSTYTNSKNSSHRQKGRHKGNSPSNKKGFGPSPLTKGSLNGKLIDDKKLTPKSPFSSSKRRDQRRRSLKENKGKISATVPNGLVFCRELSEVPSVCVYVRDGGQVTVPEFMVDAGNIIRKNLKTEGIFRKAGSSQRQTDLKHLLDSGASLPNSVHPIDAACLLKQFLRWLPQPLLPTELYPKLMRTLKLDKVEQVEALILCTLLLPRSHRHTLLYFTDLLTEVANASSDNLMDHHNLSVVLAPNLLPVSIQATPGKKISHGQHPHSEDTILASSIDIIRLLLEHASVICRIPPSISESLKARESKSTENLDIPNPPSARKKRRSASIHRLVSGFRRVVGGGHHSESSAPPFRASSDDCLNQLDSHCLSPIPASSPYKRKSCDGLDLAIEPKRSGLAESAAIPSSSSSSSTSSSVSHSIPSSSVWYIPPSKRAKTESSTACSTMGSGDASNSGVPHISIWAPTPARKAKVSRSKTFAEVSSPRPMPSSASAGTPSMGHSITGAIKRSHSERKPTSTSLGFHAIHTGLKREQSRSVKEMTKRSLSKSRPSPVVLKEEVRKATPKQSCQQGASGGHSSKEIHQSPTKVQSAQATPHRGGLLKAHWKRRSFDFINDRKSIADSQVLKAARRARRSCGNDPDGADSCPLGDRGVPDGAECNLRDSLACTPMQVSRRPVGHSPIQVSVSDLEKKYAAIKSVVRTMEDEVDHSNVQQLKASFFPEGSGSAQNMSCSEMIQSAYERMKLETQTHDLGVSPSESLSKRLGKELKIRKRRSNERSIRSPSERKIGTIRRRSRELAQNAAKNLIQVEETPSKPSQTPQLKSALLQTPLNTSLRRGKPNSVRSGLPLVVKAVNDVDQDGKTNDNNASRMITISHRLNDSDTLLPLRANFVYTPKDSPFRTTVSSPAVSGIAMGEQEGNCHLSSSSFSTSVHNKDENFMGSFLEQIPGPMTRRRSSLVSSLTNSIPLLNLGSADTSHAEDHSLSRSSNNESMTLGEQKDTDMIEGLGSLASGNSSKVLPSPVINMSNSDLGHEDWVDGSDFVDIMDSCSVAEPAGRPSLAALLRQKKVTANVQLFSQLQSTTPRSRMSRNRCTPYRVPPSRLIASEQRGISERFCQTSSPGLLHRSTMTPRELLRVKQAAARYNNPMHPVNLKSPTKHGKVSPLKESSRVNIQQEHSKDTPKGCKEEATTPGKCGAQDVFKTPSGPAPITPFRHRPKKEPSALFPSSPSHPSFTNPTALPPRLTKNSPLKMR